jgi:signal transduction histidine kinase
MYALLRRLRDVAGRHQRLSDAALAVVVLALTVQPLLQAQLRPWWAGPLVVAECAPLLWRRDRPFVAAMLVGAATALHGVVGVPEPALPWAALVALYGVAAHAARPQSLAAAAVTATVVPAILLTDGRPTSVEVYTVNGVIFGTAWLLGDATRHRRERSALLEEQAVTAERARMAREMHDVVAHHVSLMVVQAEAGAAAPGADEKVFDAIADTGRQALTELRQVLGTLRPTYAERQPVPGIDALPALLDRVRRSGLDVGYVVGGVPVPLPAAVDRAAYRVVQESLTNTVKHAGAATATVTLVYEADRVRVAVEDDGAGSAGGPGGHGLVGMRERVALLGGRFAAAPGAHGGWAVTAVLPLGGPA